MPPGGEHLAQVLRSRRKRVVSHVAPQLHGAAAATGGHCFPAALAAAADSRSDYANRGVGGTNRGVGGASIDWPSHA